MRGDKTKKGCERCLISYSLSFSTSSRSHVSESGCVFCSCVFIGRVGAFTSACVRLCCNLFALPPSLSLSLITERQHIWPDTLLISCTDWLMVMIMVCVSCVLKVAGPVCSLFGSSANCWITILLFYSRVRVRQGGQMPVSLTHTITHCQERLRARSTVVPLK